MLEPHVLEAARAFAVALANFRGDLDAATIPATRGSRKVAARLPGVLNESNRTLHNACAAVAFSWIALSPARSSRRKGKKGAKSSIQKALVRIAEDNGRLSEAFFAVAAITAIPSGRRERWHWRDVISQTTLARLDAAQRMLARIDGMLPVGIAGASSSPPFKPTPSMECILDSLRETEKRMTGPVLLKKALGKVNSRGKAALATMVKEGLITNRRDADPPGYGLPGWPS